MKSFNKEIYSNGDDDHVILEKAKSHFLKYEYLEASSWVLCKTEEGVKVACCSNCPTTTHETIDIALASLSVYPDQKQLVDVTDEQFEFLTQIEELQNKLSASERKYNNLVRAVKSDVGNTLAHVEDVKAKLVVLYKSFGGEWE